MEPVGSIVLVFNPAPNPTLPTTTRISPQLRGLCVRWLAITVDSNEKSIAELNEAMAGLEGEVITLDRTPPQQQQEQIARLIPTDPDWLLVLEPGMTVEYDTAFDPGEAAQAIELLHYSPRRDQARWRTALIPNSPEAWLLNEQQQLVARPQNETRRNRHLRILDPFLFSMKSPPGATQIDRLIQAARNRGSARSALRVAQEYAARGDDQQALAWFDDAITLSKDPGISWEAHMQSAQCLEQLDSRWETVEKRLAAAFQIDPDRMEPLYYLVAHYRAAAEIEKAVELAAIAVAIPEPEAGKAFDPALYRYKLALEYVHCLLKLNRNEQCVTLINDTLRRGEIPEPVRRELAGLRAKAYERICPRYPVQIRHHNRILVVVAFRNAGEFLARCIESLQAQSYDNFHVVVIDDDSTDGARDSIGQLDDRFTLIVNPKRVGALENQLGAIRSYADEEDIVVHLDGDDWLAHDQVLTRINEFFNRTRCWLMYSQFEDSLGRYGSCEPLVPGAEPLLQQLKPIVFPMHIRAYRAGVFFQLLAQDPALSVLRDEKNQFLDAVSDLALMRALIQVAGLEHSRYNEEILYIYNRSNPQSHYQSRQAMALQQRQSDIAGAKPPLKPADDYRQTGKEPPPTGNTRTLMLVLDGATPALLEKWVSEGQLPNLAKALARCQSRVVHCPRGFGNDAFWTTTFTGCLPGETGYFFRAKISADNYQHTFLAPEKQVSQALFWTDLADQDAELAIIDMPEVKHGGRINGLEISEWLPHARSSPFLACPDQLYEDVLERFGQDPLNGSTERSTWRSEEETLQEMERLLQSIDQKTAAAKHYLGRGGWDLFAVGYQQAHDAGHQFWHLHDPQHPRFYPGWQAQYGDPLLQVYQRIDDGIGELLNLAGERSDIVVIAGLSMQSKISCNPVLDQVLWEIDVHERRLAGQPYPSIEDLPERRFFAVPHNNLSGTIRINLAGREAQGIVKPGEDYDNTITLLKQRLSEVVNIDTGEPVIADFVETHVDCEGTNIDKLPDLIVLWAREHEIRAVTSPRFESIEVRIRGILDTRSGDHTGDATLYTNIDSMLTDPGKLAAENIRSHLVKLVIPSGQ